MRACKRPTCGVLTMTLSILCFGASEPSTAGLHDIDTSRSLITLYVDKTGLFSAFGHEHEIRAPIERGRFDEQRRTVEFTVASQKLKVMDTDVSAGDRAEVQKTMLGPQVLDRERFPEIKFRSTSIQAESPDKWTVEGELTLHGQTHTVNVSVEGANGDYRGSARVRQTDFGITPIRVAGGSVKVKDEVRVEFEIFAK
jgi:polyisoprenoid-binding protein YceI